MSKLTLTDVRKRVENFAKEAEELRRRMGELDDADGCFDCKVYQAEIRKLRKNLERKNRKEASKAGQLQGYKEAFDAALWFLPQELNLTGQDPHDAMLRKLQRGLALAGLINPLEEDE